MIGAGTSECVLVTGAGGFIGSHVVPALLAIGHRVVAVDRHWDQPRQHHNARWVDGADCLSLDMVDAPLAPVLRSVDSVIHLAGSPGVQTSWASGFDHHVRNNVVATQRLLEAALDAPVRRIVVASSSSVYGSIVGTSAAEDHPLRPLSPYGASKAAMELLVGTYVERGLSVMPLRYFTVYGPRQRPDMAIHRMIEATRGGASFGVRGDGHQERSYTHVADVVRATLRALEVSSCEPLNVGGAATASVNTVIDLVEHLSGSTVDRHEVAAVPGDPQRTSADSARAATLLGWQPQIDLVDGLREQVESQLSLAPVAI